MSNLVTTGQMGNMAQILARQLGRKVHVHRVEYRLRLPNGRYKTNIRYTLAIEGFHPPIFPGLTVNEVKGRMAMLSDLLISGVITSASPDAEHLARTDCRDALAQSERADRHGVEESGAQGDHAGVDQSPGSDDRY